MKLFSTKHLHGDGGISELAAIAFPMVVSQGCDAVMMFTDRLFLSQLGAVHMASSMSGGLTAFMLTTFFMGLTGYTTALVAQYFGSRQISQCGVVLSQALIITVLSYPLMLACIPLGHLLFEIVGDSPEQKRLSTLYFEILMLGTIISIARNSINSFFCGVGKTRIVMISSVTTMSINVVVNYILIFGKFGMPALGLKGAAIGTIIGSFCGLLIVIAGYIMYQREHPEFRILKSFRFDQVVMKKLLRFGSPGGAEFFLNLLAFDLLVLLFHSYGPNVAASFTIAFNFDLLSFIPLIGMHIGVTSLVGRYMGAGSPDKAHRSTISGLQTTVFYSGMMLILFVFFPQQLVSIFLNGPEDVKNLAPLAEYMVALVAVYVIADGVGMVYSGSLKGAGDTFWTMVISITFHWLLVGEAFVMIHFVKATPKVTWTVFVFTIPVIAIAFFLRYKSGKWKLVKVVDDDPATEVAA